VKLDELQIENYRMFEKVEVAFDGQLNLIVGANGAGKSSLLRAIATSLWESVRFLAQKADIANPIDHEDVRFVMELVGTRVRFEQRLPTSLSIRFTFDGKPVVVKERRSTTEHNLSEGNNTLDSKSRERIIRLEEDLVLPFVAFYGPKRNTKSSAPSIEEAVSERISRRHGYEGWFEAMTDIDRLQNWVIGKTLERLQCVSELGPAYSAQAEDELEVVNSVLKNVFPGSEGLRFDLRLRSLMVEFRDGKLLPFASLSDGQKGVVALLADICRRMVIMNPQLGMDAPRKTPGILMVDELDIHLHPGWQRMILRLLLESFPMLQIFASAHSPQMIGGVNPNQVLLLVDGAVMHPEVTYGLDASRVLEEIMNVESREREVDEAISLIFKDIENRNLDSAKKRIKTLKSSAPELPEYAQAEAMIRRLETVGR